MKLSDRWPIQGRRFDIETFQYNAVSLTKQANNGPTFLRHEGQVAYIIMTEELFDELWPDPQRACSIDEMPHRMEQLLLEGINNMLTETGGDEEP